MLIMFPQSLLAKRPSTKAPTYRAFFIIVESHEQSEAVAILANNCAEQHSTLHVKQSMLIVLLLLQATPNNWKKLFKEL